MARYAVGATLSSAGVRGVGSVADPVNGATIVTLKATAVSTQATAEAALAVLEADGASPTEAHVDDMRTAYDAYVAAVVAQSTATAGLPANANVVVSVDAAAITTRNQLREGLRAIAGVFEGASWVPE